jgi:uncharacterized protein (DUF488 family)
MYIYTIGHSHHDIERFVNLLRSHAVKLLIDVRSQPYSRYAPQYDLDALRDALETEGIAYLHMPSLGGRPDDPALCTSFGKPDYGRVERSLSFLQGVESLMEAAQRQRTVIMCAEADPQRCHRERLIAPILRQRGVEVRHILPDGTIAPPDEQLRLNL